MTRAWRFFAGVLLLGAATAPGFAQDTQAQAPRSEFGVRYWRREFALALFSILLRTAPKLRRIRGT